MRSFWLAALAALSVFAGLPLSDPAQVHAADPRVVLADYMMWYDPTLFDGTKTFDMPAAGPYNSDDVATIQRQVAQAQQACLDGFSPHWYGPQEPRTTANFNTLLQASAGTNLRHAAVLQSNILPRATEQMQVDAINYILQNWANHPNYLKIDGRPVVIFTDMPRPWGSTARALQGWARVRQQTDPDHHMLWMAEGYATTFLPTFDGQYVYRIDHRACPQCWLKQPMYAQNVRDRATEVGTKLYFADTIAPGFDDSRSRRISIDYRVPAPSFVRDRRAGAYYRDTFTVTAQTQGDFLLVKSFNEWVEGTAIEPSQKAGDLYLNLTCDLVRQYKGQ